MMSKTAMTLLFAIGVILIVLFVYGVQGARFVMPVCPKGYTLYDQYNTRSTILVCFDRSQGVVPDGR